MKMFRKFNLARWAFVLFVIAPAYAYYYLSLIDTRVEAAYPMVLGTFGIGLPLVFLSPVLIQPPYWLSGGSDNRYFNIMIAYYVIGFVLAIVFWRKSVKRGVEKYNLISGFISLGYCLFIVPYCIYYLFSERHGGIWTKTYFSVFLVLLLILVIFTILKLIAIQKEKKLLAKSNLPAGKLPSEEEKD
ncbi:MAG: hypothetical protein J6D37_07940 [Clostridia bacterium]|nr:hypothetical protein [Clostridia bacterium]